MQRTIAAVATGVAWAGICLAALLALAWGPLTLPDDRRPDAVYLNRPGAADWTPLGHPAPVAQFMDAVVLDDGRLAVALRSFGSGDAARPRAAHLYDPRTGVWSAGEAVMAIPAVEPPVPAGVTPPDGGTHHWVVLDAQTLLTLPRAATPRVPALRRAASPEEPLPALPEDAPAPDRFDAVRTAEGDVVLMLARGGEARVYRRTPGATSWAPLPPVPGSGTWHALERLGGGALALRGAPEMVYEGGAWRALPPAAGEVMGAALVRLPEGAIAQVGGFVAHGAQGQRLAPGAAGRKGAAAVVLALALVAAGIWLRRGARNGRAVLAGVLLGGVSLGWLLVTGLRALAWG